jgi:N-acetylmuramoyl-L-alanine amidase
MSSRSVVRVGVLCVLAAAVAMGCRGRTAPVGPDEDVVPEVVETPAPATQPTRVGDEPDGYPNTLADAFELLESRPAWSEREPLVLTRHPYEQYLRNWTIVLDPGHGGDGHLPDYKRGPTGVREAQINFRVALLLKRLLEDAGALVTLTREGDYDLGLRERAEIANTIRRPDGGVGADLFLSLHHNAAGPEANYTSVWFHGPPEYAEVELDVARPIALHLARLLRTPIPRTQPLMSDKQMYPGGFGVLKHATVPAILLESSFHSNPAEEQRLRDAVYNLREAYAIYWGLCEYARGGRPRLKDVSLTRAGEAAQLQATLDDGLFGGWGGELGRIVPSSVRVRHGQRELAHTLEPASGKLTVALDTLSAGDVLDIRFANLFKHANHPQRFRVVDDSGGLRLEPIGRPRPATPTTDRVHPEAPVGTTRPATRPQNR